MEKLHEEKIEKEKVLQTLRQASVIMTSERQRTFAEAIISTLPLEKSPTRSQVEASLSQLKIPLSTEILNIRGDR